MGDKSYQIFTFSLLVEKKKDAEVAHLSCSSPRGEKFIMTQLVRRRYFFCFTICGLIRVNMERLSNYLEDYFCNIDYVKQCTIKGKKLFWLGKVIFGSAGTSFLFGIVLNLSKSWIIFMSTLVTTGDKGRCMLKDFS